MIDARDVEDAGTPPTTIVVSAWNKASARKACKQFQRKAPSLVHVNVSNDGNERTKNLDSIEISAFESFSCLTHVHISESITMIGNWAFQRCPNLVQVSLPETLRILNLGLFQECTNLEKVTVSSRLTNIGDGVFVDCKSLVAINTHQPSLFTPSSSSSPACSSPNANPAFGESQFSKLPRTLQRIGNMAFRGCKKLEIVAKLPHSITFIGAAAFENCHAIVSIEIPPLVKKISSSTFSECHNLVAVDMSKHNSVVDIGGEAFSGCCNLESVLLSSRTIAIGRLAFKRTKITSITLPETVASISDYAFDHCLNLTSMRLPEGITRISAGTFQDCEFLSTIILPSTIIQIHRLAFRNCFALKLDALPRALTHVEDSAFYNCNNVTFRIPETITSIGASAFAKCRNITVAALSNDITMIPANCFHECERLCFLKLPLALKTISTYAFSCCKQLGWVDFPSSLKHIKSSAFADCTMLKAIVIPEATRIIDHMSFRACKSLSLVVVPMHVFTSMQGDTPFTQCPHLTSPTCSVTNPTPAQLSVRGLGGKNSCQGIVISNPAAILKAHQSRYWNLTNPLNTGSLQPWLLNILLINDRLDALSRDNANLNDDNGACGCPTKRKSLSRLNQIPPLPVELWLLILENLYFNNMVPQSTWKRPDEIEHQLSLLNIMI